MPSDYERMMDPDSALREGERVQMPTLREIAERMRRKKARREEVYGAADQAYGQMPRPDAPQADDPYIQALLEREDTQKYGQDAANPFVNPNLGTVQPSGNMDDFMQREVAMDQQRRQQEAESVSPMAGRTFEPSGPAQPQQTASLSPELIRSKVADGSMDPRVARMLLQRMGAAQ